MATVDVKGLISRNSYWATDWQADTLWQQIRCAFS